MDILLFIYLVFLCKQVELAHDGCGHSSLDRYSSYSGGRGRGVSKRSEHRGMWDIFFIYLLLY